MSAGDSAHEQLARHLVDLVASRLLDPLEILLQADLPRLRQQVSAQASIWADRLLGPDEPVAVATAVRLVSSLYPSDRPFDPTPQWWATPLGRSVARLTGHPTAEALSYAEAGAMLGISRQGVHDLVTRGKLDRHPSGGVTNGSVRARIRRAPDPERLSKKES